MVPLKMVHLNMNLFKNKYLSYSTLCHVLFYNLLGLLLINVMQL